MSCDLSRRWWDCPIVCVDLETTGVDPAKCMPVEIAVARFESGTVTGQWSSLLNPGIPIPPEATVIHNVTDEMVIGAPPAVAAVWVARDSAAELFEGAYPCGYNGQHFDRAILRRLDLMQGFDGDPAPPWLTADWLDPLIWVRDIDGLVKGQRGRHKLGTTCERWKVEHVDAHRALGDCVATGKLLWAMRDRIGPLTLGELLRRQGERGAAQQADLDRYWGRGKVHA